MNLSPAQFKGKSIAVITPDSGQSYDVSGGQTNVNFNIAGSRHVIHNKSMCLNGTMNVYTSGTTHPTNSQNLSFNNYAGVFGIIESINVRSLRSNKLINRYEHVGRAVAQEVSALNSDQNLETKFNQSLVSPILGFSKSLCETQFTFSLPLGEVCGFLRKTHNFDLAKCGGLRIEIHLSSNNQFLIDSGSSFSGAKYVISNVTLCYSQLTPDPIWSLETSRLPSLNVYDDWQTRMLQLVSANDSLLDYVSWKALKSLVVTYLSSSKFNNLSSNSFELQPIGIDSFSVLTNGVQKPLMYSQDEDASVNTNYGNLAQEYVKALAVNGSLDYVRTQLSTGNYPTASNESSAFGTGCLYDDQGTPVQGQITVIVNSDISVNTSAFVTYKHERIVEMMNGDVNVLV